jgi:DNA-binding transcriptional ArsR family regulator
VAYDSRVAAKRNPITRPEVVLLRDAAAIKTLAHPARLVILDELMPDNELTATEIAEVAGITPSAMSYHLRQLAKWKIVEEAESKDGRERRWKLHPGGWGIDPEHPRASLAAETTLVAQMLNRQREDVLRWFASREAEDPVWHEATVLTTAYVWLTSDEALALSAAVQEKVDSYRGRSDPKKRPKGARRVQVGYLAVPGTPRPSRGRTD